MPLCLEVTVHVGGVEPLVEISIVDVGYMDYLYLSSPRVQQSI